MSSTESTSIRHRVAQIVSETPVFDLHTHLFSARFGDLLLYGIDELLTYHYLIAEVFRAAPMDYDRFWQMNKQAQADYIWDQLFIRRSPVSEACRGVLTVLQAFGIDLTARELKTIRQHLATIPTAAYIDQVFKLANVQTVVMTNDPFDPDERPAWDDGPEVDHRFQPALRIDPLLNDWDTAAARLHEWGYQVHGTLDANDVDSVKRFLRDWVEGIRPRYMAVSLPPTFRFPEDSSRAKLIEQCVLPIAAEQDIPFAMMIGVKRGVNPRLKLAADGVGLGDVDSVSHLCSQFPNNRFMVTMLARENQHELCVTSRKHPNLLPFGCWWFLNNPSIIDEMTRERFELLGTSFVPQHSDARVLDQIIYKWKHSRAIIADVLADKYEDLARTGWHVSEDQMKRDIKGLLGETFNEFCEKPMPSSSK
jgi:hypothetical protein